MIRLVYDKVGTANASTHEAVAKNRSLEDALYAYPDSHLEETLESSDKIVERYYPIVPTWAEKTFGGSGPGFFNAISPQALAKLQDAQDGLKLLIFFPWEGFDLNFKKYLIINYLNLLGSEYGIDGNKILLCFGDINLKESLKFNKVKLNIPDTNILGLNLFERIAFFDSKNINRIPPLEFPLNRKKRFICKNGVARPQRMYLAGAFYNKKLLDKFYFSWLNHTKWEYSDTSLYAFSKYNNGKINRDYYYSFLEFVKKEPYILDITSEDATDRVNQVYINTKLYNESYASLVTETVVDDYNKGVLFLSEKTYQPIYNLHPFINVGGPGILKLLRDDGYATFPELFDESYDEIKNCSGRINQIITEVEKFCNKDSKVLDDIYSSKTFQDKLLHNFNNFRNRKGREQIKKLINWLERKNTFTSA